MKIQEIAFSCYAVTDIRKARAFYEGVLGLKPSSVFETDVMAFIEYEIGPHVLAIGAGAPLLKPGPGGATVTFEVENFDKAVAKLREVNATFLSQPSDTGVCHMAFVSDPDGNTVGIHKRKKN